MALRRAGPASVHLQGSLVAATLVAEGHAPVRERADLAPAPAPSAARAVARVAREAQGAPSTTEARRAALATWREVTAEGTDDPEQIGRLAAALDDLALRDAVLVQMVPGGASAADDVVSGASATGSLDAALAGVLDPDGGVEPAEDAEAARALLVQIASHVNSAPAHTLLAFAAWWKGDGSRANVLIDRARALDPDYRLAVLIEQVLLAGLRPGWTRGPR